MCEDKRNKSNPFYLNNGRAMVSLGPLNENRHCTFRCAFCYVQDDFLSYAKLSINEIIDFLKKYRIDYNIIYVSGDTDSFAPPRTDEGLELLHAITKEINCDLLFTTRTSFNKAHYSKLKEIINEQIKGDKRLFACISITRLSANNKFLEPYPVPSPDERIRVLKNIKELGATTVLALRPFLPMVDINEYITIIDKTKEFVDIVLGEDFYFISGGNVEKRVFPNGISPDIEYNITRNKKMTFDDNKSLWNIWSSKKYEQAIANKCKEYGIIFSIHSDIAISEYMKNLKKTELWDLYDENRQRTGETVQRGVVIPQGSYHLVAGAWIRNSQGQFLISQRHPNKNYPNYWECTGGSISAGENSLEGAIREVHEELGIVLSSDNAILIHQERRDKMQDFYDAWLFHADIPVTSLKLQSTEVTSAKWVNIETLYKMFLNNEIHPLIDYIDKILRTIQKLK